MLTLLLALACAKPDADTADSGIDDTDIERCDFYADADGDGWGVLAEVTEADCEHPPAGVAEASGDCDDADAAVHPDAPERCNAIDDDCDGTVDDDPTDALVGYPDVDGDGYGAAGGAVRACGALPADHIARGGDCDDADAAVHPDVEDLDCDNVDDDCDGEVDGGWRVPEDQLDIQVAFNSAPEGATICVGPGTYVTGLDFHGRGSRIVGREGPDVTIIDAAAAFSAVKFTSGEGPDSILEGFTIRNGSAPQGAGVYVRDASPTLRDLVITGNFCADASTIGRCDGTGVWISGGAPVFEDVVIRGNTQDAAISFGAGVYIGAGSPVFRRVEIAENIQTGVESTSFLSGAGVYVTGASPVLDTVTVSGNTQTYAGTSAASLEGAGIYAYATTAAWTGLTLAGNTQLFGGANGNASGAGLYASAATVLTLDDTRITGNTADATAPGPNGYAAGIAAYAGVDVTLRNSVVSGNRVTMPGTAFVHGGGFYGRTDVNFTLENTLVVGNVAHAPYAYGGGMYLEPGADATLTNSILAGNVVAGNATGRGAGIFARNNTVTLTQVDVVGNECASSVCNGVAFNLYTQTRLTFDGVNVVGNTGTSGRTSGGAIHAEYTGPGEASTFTSTWSNMYGNESSELSGVTTPSVGDGNVFVDPRYTDTTAVDPLDWDLTLAADSPVRDAGNLGATDADGTRADVGAFGGPGGAW